MRINRRQRRDRTAKLAKLTPAQRKKLLTYLDRDNLTYEQAVVRIREEFGLTVSPASVGKWWQRFYGQRIAQAQAAQSPPVIFEIVIQVRANGAAVVIGKGGKPT